MRFSIIWVVAPLNIGRSTYVQWRGFPPSPGLLHPGVLLPRLLHLLVDGLEGEPETARVDLSVGQTERRAGVLVLLVREVPEEDSPRVVVGHLATVGLRRCGGLLLEFLDSGLEFDDHDDRLREGLDLDGLRDRGRQGFNVHL